MLLIRDGLKTERHKQLENENMEKDFIEIVINKRAEVAILTSDKIDF